MWVATSPSSATSSVRYGSRPRPRRAYYVTRSRGMGDVTRAQLANTAGATAGTVIMSLAPLAGPAAPFVLAAGAIVSGLTVLFTQVFAGCGATCVQATRVVDTVESQYMRPLLDQWRSLPVKTASAQAAALQAFDYAWSMVLEGCSDPALGDAGRRCISERSQTGSLPGHPGVNWFTLYRDPIANDPDVVPDPPVTPSSVGGDVLTQIGVNPDTPILGQLTAKDLVIPGVLILAGLLL